MEMVAASRMRRAQQAVLAGRPYSEKMADVIRNLAQRIQAQGGDESINPLIQKRPIQKATVIMVTANRGLAGALNTNIIRRTTRFILDEAGVPVNIVALGRKGRDFMIRYGRPVIAEFVNLPDYPHISDIYPIARVAIDEYRTRRTDAVYLVYTDFVNTLVQRPVLYQLLPVNPEGTDLPDQQPQTTQPQPGTVDYIYEPGPRQVLAQIMPRYVEALIYQALLEHSASEQSARMVAMRNATQNAKEMISDLTLAYNKLRQANITREIIEVSSGASALTG